MIFNAVMAARAFDPYPYILLNLVLPKNMEAEKVTEKKKTAEKA